jgi:hypothetical protein
MTANHSSYLQIPEIADGKVHGGMASCIHSRREIKWDVESRAREPTIARAKDSFAIYERPWTIGVMLEVAEFEAVRTTRDKTR